MSLSTAHTQQGIDKFRLSPGQEGHHPQGVDALGTQAGDLRMLPDGFLHQKLTVLCRPAGAGPQNPCPGRAPAALPLAPKFAVGLGKHHPAVLAKLGQLLRPCLPQVQPAAAQEGPIPLQNWNLSLSRGNRQRR